MDSLVDLQRSKLLLLAFALGGCISPIVVVDEDPEGSSSGDGSSGDPPITTTAGPTTSPPSTTTTTTTTDPDSGTGFDTDGCVCPPGQACIGGVCFDCPDPVCEPPCAANELCQCPPVDECCGVGICEPVDCPAEPIPGNYEACLVDGAPDDGPCGGASCVVDNDANPSAGVCMVTGCDFECQCPPPPPTGDAPVTCEDVLGDGVGNCWLDCQSGSTCPDGMECFGGFICIWSEAGPPPPPPPPPSAYGDCANNPTATCQPGEDACLLAAGMVPTAGACSQTGCISAMDCPAAPPTGNAPVACNAFGGGNTCYLDCEMGQACPTGMVCTNVGMGMGMNAGMACLWPDQGRLLDEDFELGILRPGWTVIDVDGQTPDPGVAFVDDAFVVTDQLEPGANFGAYSTSWYTPLGQADDWLVTPALTLGPASMLSWEAWAPDPSFPDGYEVRISTTGPTVMGFLANPSLLVVPAEAQIFTGHMVDLAAAGYANQDVHLAWRNNSDDDFILVVDDIVVTQ